MPPSPIPSEEARDALVTAAEQHFSNSQKGSDDRGGDVRSKDEVRGMHDGASSTITALERLVEQEEEALRQERAILDQGIEVLSALETAAKEADAQLARESRDAVIEVSGFLKSTALLKASFALTPALLFFSNISAMIWSGCTFC